MGQDFSCLVLSWLPATLEHFATILSFWVQLGIFQCQGGDSSAVEHLLVDVRCVCPSSYAFAALKNDGSVVCWGCASAGGDCFAVQDNLHWAYGLLMSVHYGGHAKNSPGFDKDEQESEISEIAFLWFNLFNDDFLCPQSPGSTSRRVPAVWGHLGFHSCEKRWLCSDLG